jgi:hypothetical protein
MGLARPGAHLPLTLEDGKEGIASGSIDRHDIIYLGLLAWNVHVSKQPYDVKGEVLLVQSVV